jgi:O-acetyl-ADP-ribose deacetylase (regulator of RNase III)
MSSIEYVVGDATQPLGDGPRIIVHICNDLGRWGKGFVLAISKRWSQPEHAYKDWAANRQDTGFELGQVQFVEVEPRLWVANLVGQHNIRPQETTPIRYEWVRAGLRHVAEFARKHNASLHMPRIGCGLAGGDWESISQIIEAEISAHDIDVTVYDIES